MLTSRSISNSQFMYSWSILGLIGVAAAPIFVLGSLFYFAKMFIGG
jgi:hypothetical protein